LSFKRETNQQLLEGDEILLVLDHFMK